MLNKTWSTEEIQGADTRRETDWLTGSERSKEGLNNKWNTGEQEKSRGKGQRQEVKTRHEDSKIRWETNYNREPSCDMFCIRKQNGAIRCKLEIN